ncbi:MAG: CDGSH iron-sulfur domain-containing protein [Phycisphaerales bacterium]|nr:MAG: CDGSH iron-sulfur domain-containing protein [Phycisphaerales bacterium]
MARLVRLEATEPIELKPQTRSVWICACGLSRNFPFCDGSHRRIRNESPDQLACYDSKGRRIEPNIEHPGE